MILQKKYFLISLLVLITLFYKAQIQTSASAKFSFNDKKEVDEITGKKVQLRGVTFTYDRFGNENSAIYLFGNQYSYINLGNYKALKPKRGSISLWIKIENEVLAGQGYRFNPILMTKCASGDDFFEAYSLFYLPETKKLNVTCTQDSTKQIGITAVRPIEHFEWHHMVTTYDDQSLTLYIDGKLEKKLPKNYETQFLESDSVLIGSTANLKNQRYLMATVDDISFYDKVLSEEEVKDLFYAPNPKKNKLIIEWLLVCLIIIIGGALIYFVIKQQVKKGIIKEKQQLELNNRLLETELRVNRASMNPHFLFNSLNALHNLILNNEIDNASDYLVKFSKLIRKILDSNMYESISLELEIELLELYLEIENLRFEENIKYTIITDDSLILSSLHIPIMMLQPFLENAIWHGLLNKEGEKKIIITFSLHEEKYIYCTVEDNGTGRKNVHENPIEKKSMATNFIFQRLELLNKIHKLKCSLLIEDKPNNTGTIVKIILPILN